MLDVYMLLMLDVYMILMLDVLVRIHARCIHILMLDVRCIHDFDNRCISENTC
jgi:hypothetical protein